MADSNGTAMNGAAGAVLTEEEVKAAARQISATLVERQVMWDKEIEAQLALPPSEDDSAAWLEEQLQLEMDQLATDRTRSGQMMLSETAEDELAQAIRVQLSPMRVLGELLKNPKAENILANDYRTTWIVEAGGIKYRGPALADSEEEFRELLRMIGIRYGRSERRFDAANPILDVQLPGGHRLNAMMDISGPACASIRRHGHIAVSLHDLVSYGTMDHGLASFLAAATRRPEPANILIAGGTNAGKTTLLRALVDTIADHNPDDRILTVEDNLELMLRSNPKLRDVIEMESRRPNVEGQGEFTMADCVKNALRMSPDRLIVGEVRGGEVIDMLNAMSTGNDGSLGTIHAESAHTAIDKVAQYGHTAGLAEEATYSYLRGAVNLIVHIKMLAAGERAITSVLEITGAKTDDGGVQTLQLWAPDETGRAARTGVQPTERLKTRLRGGGFDVGGSW